jgi:NDP-sugar pyrophosphorylase family protein
MALRAGIFAAGFGSRLGNVSGRPKGLTPIGGRPLIDWILQDLEAAGVSETVVIVNEQSIALRDYVDRRNPADRLRQGYGGPPKLHAEAEAGSHNVSSVRWIVETTPSSMHSFLRVMEELARGGGKDPFLISTVDTIAPPGTFRTFVNLAQGAPSADVVMALTSRIEDEHPLKVDTDSRRRAAGEAGAPILAIGEGSYATAGYYFVRSSVLREAAAGRAANFPALRVFFRHLFDRGYRLTGVCMPDSVDVDRPSDIEAAEQLLRSSAPLPS